MYSDERYVPRAVEGGRARVCAEEFRGRGTDPHDLRGEEGEAFFSPAVARARPKDASDVNDRYELPTNRERQVFQMLAEGNSNKEVANRLNLSLHTVETHRWRIMEKLDLHSSARRRLSGGVLAYSGRRAAPMTPEPAKPPEFLGLYRRAFLEYGAQALWNKRFLDAPTKEDALVVARALRIEGDREARRLAEQIERVCRAAI